MDEKKEVNGVNGQELDGQERGLQLAEERLPAPATTERISVFADSFMEFITQQGTMQALPDGFEIRALRTSDYDRGFMNLLAQLEEVGDVTLFMFKQRFAAMRKTSPPSYYVLVIEDTNEKRIVGTATLCLEWKFIHGAGCRGRVEDFVVDRNVGDFQEQFKKVLFDYILAIARHVDMYKLSLECKDDLVPYYEQFGFAKDTGNSFLVRHFNGSLAD